MIHALEVHRESLVPNDCYSPSGCLPDTRSNSTRRRGNPPEIRFLECDNHYWIHRGTSDTLYYGGGGSLNSAHADRFQGRDIPGFPRLSPWHKAKTPIVTEWTEERKVREFPMEDARKP